MLVRTGIVLNF